MEFIGENGVPAPLLKEVKLTNATAIYKELLHSLRLLYRRARLVHGDLSEYNVMIWKGKPVIFDISQAVTLEHPLADMLLRRDIDNLNNYFRKNRVKIKTSDEIYRWVVNESGD
jgi:RIO kinase 1